jgi:uncharacterized membrane protein YhfC
MELPFWTAIAGNIWLMGIFGGFMAGLFEEAGRFVAFKSVLRKNRGKDANALMYGAGHGGVEAAILLGGGMIINIVYSLQFNAGVTPIGGSLDAARQLLSTPWWMFFVSVAERIGAVTIQIALSVLVWFAAKNNKRFWLFPLAILLHLLVDAVAVILRDKGASVWVIEGVVYVIAIALVVLAVSVWKKNHTPEEPAQAAETPADAQA